jgi:hypothetical protein
MISRSARGDTGTVIFDFNLQNQRIVANIDDYSTHWPYVFKLFDILIEYKLVYYTVFPRLALGTFSENRFRWFDSSFSKFDIDKSIISAFTFCIHTKTAVRF